MTGKVDYYRTAYLTLFVLAGICVLMYQEFETKMIKNSMIFFFILIGALGTALRSFELKLEKAEQNFNENDKKKQ
jgi:hypothetical protein